MRIQEDQFRYTGSRVDSLGILGLSKAWSGWFRYPGSIQELRVQFWYTGSIQGVERIV